MTEERFEDLVNLYLDNEISRHELEELKRVIKENLVRRKQFERACQLHQAARKALVSRPSEGAANAESPQSAEEQAATRSSQRPTIDQMQPRAMINATVPTMAERQMNRGVAATVNLSDVTTGRRRRSASLGGGGGKRITAKGLVFLGGMALALAGWYYMFGPRQQNDDSYSPEATDTPALPNQDKGNPAADQFRSAADGGEFQPLSAQDVIQQRMAVSAVTGNTVMQPFLVERLSQSSTVVVQNGNATRQWSTNYNEQLFFKPGDVNVSPPLPDQLKSATGNAPTLQSGVVPIGPAQGPGGVGIMVGPDSSGAAGNNTGGKDLQP